MSSSEWSKTSLGDICEIIGGGTPKTSVNKYWGGEIPWLSVVDFKSDNRYVHTTEKTITTVGLKNSSTKMLNKGDLIISARGTVGALAQLSKPMAFNQSCYGLRSNDKAVNDFLYYAIKNIIKEIRSKTHGSVFSTITRDTFNILEIFLPTLKEQKAIAATLSCLDDMIELNNRTNEVLEEMAQAIFKRWFVDFEFPNENGEPYKSSGGEMVGSELGEIPRGWELGVLRDILVLNYGKSLPAKNRNAGKIKVFSSAGVTGYHDIPLVSEPSIIVGRKGTIGTVYYCEEPSFCIDTAYYTTQNDCKYPLLIAYQLLKNLNLNIYNEDSAVPGLNRNTVYAIKIAIPPDHILNWCNDVISLIHNFVFKNNYSNNSLAKIRDTLLPKLMSGEIRVPIEEVG